MKEHTVDLEETLRMSCKEYGDQIRHYSTVRSGLTTFLLTVASGAFSEYFKNANHPFLIVTGFIFLLSAPIACLVFSRRTEKAVLRSKEAWAYLKGEKAMQGGKFPDLDPTWLAVWQRVFRDKLNWLLLIACGAILLAVVREADIGCILAFYVAPCR